MLMGESLLTALSMENHHPSTLLSMDPVGIPHSSSPSDDSDLIQQHHIQHRNHNHNHTHNQQQMVVNVLSRPPDINLPLSSDRLSPPNPWGDADDILEVSLAPHSIYDSNDTIAATLSLPTKPGNSTIPTPCPQNRKCAKRGDSIWGAWFFFNFYFKPVISEKSKTKVTRDANGVSGFDKSNIRLDVFLVQHDMENMYMWVFKERPEHALGKMQLRSYMNGHSRLGEPQFPFGVDKGFVRSHRMQRKQYRGLSNPQCVHGVELVRSPNLNILPEADRKKWVELTGREPNFSIPPDASDFGSWRNLPSTEFELERHPGPLKTGSSNSHQRKLLNGSSFNLSTQSTSNHLGSEGTDLSPTCKRKKGCFLPHPMDEDCCLPMSSYADKNQEMDVHPVEPAWLQEFSGVMRHAYGPVTAAKTIYEDDHGYLIMVSLPFSDQQRVKVSWKNCLTHGVVKIACYSTGRMPYIKRHDRTFKLADPSPEHCPSGEFVREIPLATRIPEDAKLEAYYDETGTVLEIMVPKHRVGPEEHEVHVCMRPPHLGANELLLT